MIQFEVQLNINIQRLLLELQLDRDIHRQEYPLKRFVVANQHSETNPSVLFFFLLKYSVQTRCSRYTR